MKKMLFVSLQSEQLWNTFFVLFLSKRIWTVLKSSSVYFQRVLESSVAPKSQKTLYRSLKWSAYWLTLMSEGWRFNMKFIYTLVISCLQKWHLTYHVNLKHLLPFYEWKTSLTETIDAWRDSIDLPYSH